MNECIDHIGYVVKKLDESIKFYNKNYRFVQITKKITEPAHGVELVFVGNPKYFTVFELITPSSNKSKVYNFLKKNGEGFHHIAFQVDNIENSIKKYLKNGSIQLCEIVLGAGHNNAKTVWLYTKKKQLVELIEKQKNKIFNKRFSKMIVKE